MTLQELLDECKNDINSEVAFQKILAEHDKQIREEAIDLLVSKINQRLLRLEPIDSDELEIIANKLKEQK